MHENLSDDHVVEGPTNRSFGLVFAALFLGIGIWPVVSNHEVRWWAIGASGLLVFLALLLPGVLAHPNRLWMKLGLALGKVTSTVALTVLFFFVITPSGILLKLFGKDPMKLRFDPSADTYWILRPPREGNKSSNDMTEPF